MAPVFQQIPDWFSFENEGGNIAAADLSGTGKRDLVVLMVDGGPGQNRCCYRIGKDLDGGGVTGGWTQWIDIPDWGSWDNQGAGVAVGDIDGDGKQDLFVLRVDNPAGKNEGFYRVGKALDNNGNVTGGWGPWLAVPDWFSWENQHASIAVGDLNADGQLELVVFMVDNGPEQNRGVYRIGRKLDAAGNVTGGWTPWIDVPDWFSWENAGAGVSLIDLNNTGKTDLFVFQIDNAEEQNQAFYKIGSALDADGNVTGWSLWRGVPAWFSWENQGGGIAAFRRNGKAEMAVMLIDNPPGKNEGWYKTLPLDNVPQRDGSWQLLNFDSEVLAVHAALLPKGKVLFFAGSGSSATRFNSPIFGNNAQGIFMSAVWDPPQNSFAHPNTLTAPDGKPFDYFCCGHAFLPDGRLVAAGGTLGYNPFRGRKEAAAFNPQNNQWSFIAPMAHGRWYPTLTTLGDGRILAATGLTEDFGNPHNETLEIYSPQTNSWTVRDFKDEFPGLPLYAHLFLMEDGRIFFTGGRMDDELEVDPCIIDLTTNPLTTTPVFGGTGKGMRNQSASVILPPAQDQKIMVIGGGPAGKPNKTDAIDNVDIVDLKAANPQFVPAAPLNFPRLHLNAVLLPDRTVFVTGGSLKQEDEPLARLQSEIYDPAANTWTPTAAHTVPRLYHSTAILLEDGRVAACGGNPDGGQSVQWNQDPEEEMRLEVFSPPYLFKGPRPQITAAPEEWHYGETINVQTPNAGGLRWAHLISSCATTHSFDMHQRLVALDIVSQAGGVLKLMVTGNSNIAPPGWYMLFIVNTAGVPSVAKWVHLT